MYNVLAIIFNIICDCISDIRGKEKILFFTFVYLV